MDPKTVTIFSVFVLIFAFYVYKRIIIPSSKKKALGMQAHFSAKPFRDLTNKEKEELDLLHKSMIKSSIFCFGMLLGALIVLFLTRSRLEVDFVIGSALFVAVVALFLGIYFAYDASLLARDRKSQVYKVQGPMFKDREMFVRSSSQKFITVANTRFSFHSAFKEELEPIYNESDQGTNLMIEYSPHTKLVWVVKKV